MTASLFRQEAIEHRRQRLLGEVVLSQPPAYRAFTLLALGVLAVAVLVLVLGRYARSERVPGYLRPVGGFVEVSASRQGVVQAVAVADGEQVALDAPLLTVGTEAYLASGEAVAASQLRALEDQLRELRDGIERNREQQRLEGVRAEQRQALLLGRLESLHAQRRLQGEVIGLAGEQVEVLDGLLTKGQATARELREYRVRLLTARQTLAELETQIGASEGELRELRIEADRRRLQLLQERTALELRLSDLAQRRAEVSGNEAVVLRAPVAGTVTALRAHAGQAVEPGTAMLAILPLGRALEAELLVPPRSAGRLRSGLAVKLRYSAFPHRRYGVYDGEVIGVARSPVDLRNSLFSPAAASGPAYPVRVAIADQSVAADGRLLPLQAGMTLEADIVIEREPLWAILFSSFLPKG